ncbi:MAG: hypothetical protein GX978_03705 [Tissierellia bacterium]|nr:hypothetical protein [Tissierellia bacterium]
MLDEKKCETVANYLLRRGRPLDIVRYRFHNGETSGRHVLQYLKSFQNEDGGYAHGLESDIQMPVSSPLVTWAATRILRKVIESPVTEIQVKMLFDYLRDTSEFVNGRWRASIPAMNDYPHAPWWTFDEETEEQTWRYNPTAELAGFILRFKSPSSNQTANNLYTRAEKIIRAMIPVITADDYNLTGHELSNFTTLYKDLLIAGRLDLLPHDFGDFLQTKVKQALTNDLADYRAGEYGNVPSMFIMSKDNPYYQENKDVAEDYADFLEETLMKEGYWNPNWTWGQEELPPDVLDDWRSSLTVENMIYLKGLKRA